MHLKTLRIFIKYQGLSENHNEKNNTEESAF